MGQNCVKAYKKQRTKKVDLTVDSMIGSVTVTRDTFKLKREEHQGQVRKWQAAIDTSKACIKGVATRTQRAVLLELTRRRMIAEKEVAQYSTAERKAEASLHSLDRMRTHATLLDQQETLSRGYKKLQKIGLSVSGAEKKIDSATDALEDINDFNDAFTQESTPELTDEEEAAILTEVDDDQSARAMVNAPTVRKPLRAIAAAAAGVPDVEQQADEVEVEVENLLLETD